MLIFLVVALCFINYLEVVVTIFVLFSLFLAMKYHKNSKTQATKFLIINPSSPSPRIFFKIILFSVIFLFVL